MRLQQSFIPSNPQIIGAAPPPPPPPSPPPCSCHQFWPRHRCRCQRCRCQPAALSVSRPDCVCRKIKAEGFPGLVSLTPSQSISQPMWLTNDWITSECQWMAGGVVAGLTSPPSPFPIAVTFSLAPFCPWCATRPLMTVYFQSTCHSLACNISPQIASSVTLNIAVTRFLYCHVPQGPIFTSEIFTSVEIIIITFIYFFNKFYRSPENIFSKQQKKTLLCDITKGWIPLCVCVCVKAHALWKIRQAKWVNFHVQLFFCFLFFYKYTL